ncbi:family 78 glycoside hydrolase catalytic domain [Edaphobacter sp. HDX4]|uniref:alpha-L-rhamnosidase n=1 Tax=Edaphobacter sp. HDX4 TaxID=2794064 RepID=UPI002FE68ADB
MGIPCSFKVRHGIAVLLVAAVQVAYAAPVNLRVERRVDPLGIDVMRPTFSWQSDSLERDWKQSAYRVRVASTRAVLAAGKADVWDSGRVTSSESVGIAYAGPELKSRERYYWAVEVWDGHNKSAHPVGSSWWEMGLLRPEDWTANWIYREDEEAATELREMKVIGSPAAKLEKAEQPRKVAFRYQLHLEEKLFAASLHVYSPGKFTTRVNGTVAGHKADWNAFDREEIGDLLHYGAGPAGDNLITFDVDAQSARNGELPLPATVAAVLRLEQSPGKHKVIVTNRDWQASNNTDWAAAKELGPVSEQPLEPAMFGPPKTAPTRIDSETSLLRKEFSAQGGVVSARLYVTALGSYRFFLNGHRVGNDVLTPGFTDFNKRALYQTYDVTALMDRTGKNVLTAMLGAGWHGSPMLWIGARLFPGPDLLRAQLELRYADGSRKTVDTDGSWKAASSPIVSSEIYAGEAYDARLANEGWDGAKAEGSQWSAAVVGKIPEGIDVSAQPDMPIHQTQTVHPVSVKMASGDAVFDMGQNMVGVARLHVRGPAGTVVRLRFAERLNPDGTIYTENLRNADATDTYILSGKGEEVWEPAFTFHGFRYVQVSGYPGKPLPTAIEGEVWNSLEPQPSFRLKTSSDLLNSMYELGIWGQRGNFVSIPTDCPQRDERLGWMGDAGVFWRTGSYNFDIDAFSHKFMQDVVDAQTAGGAFSNVSPDLLGTTDAQPGAPGWGDAGVLVPYATWMQYGDRTILERNWAAMERWMDYILRTNPNYLRQKDLGANFADWLAPDPRSPKDLVGTAYWALLALQMEEMSTALGRADDAAKYKSLYGRIAEAYRREYVHADGSVAGDTQTAYVLTLYAGLAPKGSEKEMMERLVKDIEAHQNHLTTGFLGTPFLMFVLEEHGRADVAYKLLLSDTYPSWGYMVKKGATTWWERWNGDTGDPAMNSYNHYSFGSVMAWVYRRVAGIDTDAMGAGFHHVTIRPQVGSGLTHVHGEYDSAYGTVTTDWTRGADGKMALSVHVPANSSATVYLPNEGATAVTEGGKKLEASSMDGFFVVPVGAGTYRFALR